jgi:hypothetical protein
MLAAVLDIRRWLAEDRDTPFEERLRRDRGIGRRLQQDAASGAAGSRPQGARQTLLRVFAWWRALQSQSSVSPSTPSGEAVAHACALGSAALALLGGVSGVAVSGAAFAYQGQYPVNLFTLLGVLVALPLLLLLMTLLLLLPGRLPGADGARTVLEGLNAGRWLGAWLDRYFSMDLFGAFAGPRPRTGFARWQLLVFSQWLAVGFFAGALVLGLLLVTFTDLAFGWSTTLQLSATRVHGWVSIIAAPWAAWWPAAVPDLALVEASRYFRLEQGAMPPSRVSALGSWWPFVLVTLVTYGLLPRLVLLVFCYWRRWLAIRRLLLLDPETTALLDRLSAPLVALDGTPEEESLQTPSQSLPAPSPARIAADGDAVFVVWNLVAPEARLADWAGGMLGLRPRAILFMSVLQTLDEQTELLGRLKRPVPRVLVFTKGWEPPLLEFMDFLGLLRERVGASCSVTVVPINLAGTGVDPQERGVWSRALGRLRDPGLTVMEALS